MFKTYCVIDNAGRFITSVDNIQESEYDIKNTVKAIPPVVKEGFVAFWERDSWKIKKKTIKDDLNYEYYEHLKKILDYEKIKVEVSRNTTIVPQRKGSLVTSEYLLNALDVELRKYRSIILKTMQSKKEVPQIFKEYVVEILNKIEEIKRLNIVFTDYRFELDSTIFDIGEILNNKSLAEEALANNTWHFK